MALVAAAARDPIIWRQGGHEILEIISVALFKTKSELKHYSLLDNVLPFLSRWP